jgi:hypothetical protein
MIAAGYRIAGFFALLMTLGVATSAAEPWYSQPPLQGTGPGLYYSYYPQDVPGYPQELRGLPVPIFPTSNPVSDRYATGDGDGWSAHVGWCQERWLSYRASDNSYQPLYGPRRQCRSPYL